MTRMLFSVHETASVIHFV